MGRWSTKMAPFSVRSIRAISRMTEENVIASVIIMIQLNRPARPNWNPTAVMDATVIQIKPNQICDGIRYRSPTVKRSRCVFES